jgi:hypothetical protein
MMVSTRLLCFLFASSQHIVERVMTDALPVAEHTTYIRVCNSGK